METLQKLELKGNRSDMNKYLRIQVFVSKLPAYIYPEGIVAMLVLFGILMFFDKIFDKIK